MFTAFGTRPIAWQIPIEEKLPLGRMERYSSWISALSRNGNLYVHDSRQLDHSGLKAAVASADTFCQIERKAPGMETTALQSVRNTRIMSGRKRLTIKPSAASDTGLIYKS